MLMSRLRLSSKSAKRTVDLSPSWSLAEIASSKPVDINDEEVIGGFDTQLMALNSLFR